MASVLQRLAKKGFVGPHYRGVAGKARMAWEHWVFRTDVISMANRFSIDSVPEPEGPALTLRIVDDAEALLAYQRQFEREYYTGYLDPWIRAFGWGERLALGLIRDEVAGFYWIQDGTAAGNRSYYGVLLKGDARILRAGVVPSRRRQGVYTQLTRDLLCHHRGVSQFWGKA